MTALLHVYSSFESLLIHGGYFIIALVAVVEAAPLIGTFIPGHSLIIAAGFFARTGVLNLWLVILATTLGSIAGDMLGYWTGKRFGYDVVTKYGKYFFIEEEQLNKARKLLDKHTGSALIIGRFNPVTRALTPFIAGVSNLHIKRFWIYNVVGGFLWSAASVLLGYAFGASYSYVTKYLGKFIFVATILSVLIVWGYQFVNSRRHIFQKYHLYTLIVNILSLYVLSKTVQDALSGDSALAQLDVWMNLKMVPLHSPGYITLAQYVSNIISPTVLGVFGVGLIAYLAYRKEWYHIALTVFGLLGGYGLQAFLKDIFLRIRPENALVHVTDYSFPSGHATIAVIFFSLVIYMFNSRMKRRYIQEIFAAVNLLLLLAVGFSRIYLNVHWFSDVIAGYALGFFWMSLVLLTIKFVHSIIAQKLSPRKEAIVERKFI